MNKILRSYRLPEDVVEGLEAIPIGRMTDHVVLALREYLDRQGGVKPSKSRPPSRPQSPPKSPGKTDNKGARFVRPSTQEVEIYCSENNFDIDAQGFIDYYESNGWKVGKNSMKDWRACIRTWVKRKAEKPKEVKRESLIERTTRKAKESIKSNNLILDDIMAGDGENLFLQVDKR
jgi:hypothetical protein